MAAYWLILLFCVVGVESEVFSQTFVGNSKAYLKPQWIHQHMIEGRRNVSVRYAAFNDATALWKVDDVIISGIDQDYEVSTLSYYHDSIHDSSTVRMASILLPTSGSVDKLELRLVLDVHDVTLFINLPALGPGESRVDYVQYYNFYMRPSEHIQYDPAAPLDIYTSFEGKDLDNQHWIPTRARFVTINKDVHPPVVAVKTSQNNQDFITVGEPENSEIPSSIRWQVQDISNFKMRMVRMPLTSERFWGLLKVTTGFRMTDTCSLFGGVEVTQTSFLRSPDHSDFFTANTTSFIGPIDDVTVTQGGNADISMSALGGASKEWYGEEEQEYPRVSLFKDNQETTGSERIDVLRLFQREVIFRFRDISSGDAGTYEARATYQSGSNVRRFRIIVN